MENWKKKAVELITNLGLSYKENPSVTEYNPSKTEISKEEFPTLSRSTPEKHGISSKRIYNMLTALEKEAKANVHSIIVVKDEEVICEASKQGYSTTRWHLSHSMTKTVTGMAIGLLYDDGYISVSDKVADFFPEYKIADKNFKNLTVEDLLSMSSGSTFGEAGSVTESEWTRAFFESPLRFIPGEAFAYNSMNSYILARIADKILREKENKTLSEYIAERIFMPLQIKNFLFEKGPEDVEKGGWGLYMSVESWAKLGIMMLNNGVFNGKRILSKKWVAESCSMQISTPEGSGDYSYGYHLWVSKTTADFLFNGMLGQNVWVCPKNNIVVAITCGNNELFQESPALKIITETLGGDINLDELRIKKDISLLKEKQKTFFDSREWITPKKSMHGLLYLFGIKNPQPFAPEFNTLLGDYEFARNNQGILPLFVRVMQNNYSGKISRFSFRRDGERLFLYVSEGEQEYPIELGMYGYKESIVDYNGEKYILNSAIQAREETDTANAVYDIEIVFSELPNTRRMTLIIDPNGKMTVEMSEIPDNAIADAFLNSEELINPQSNMIMELINRNLGTNFISDKIREIFYPILVAASTESPYMDDILSEENAILERKINSSALIRSLIYRFIGVEEEGEEKKQKSFGGMLLSSIFGKLF